MAKSNTPYLVVKGLAKHYGDGEARVQVLDNITTTINRGEIGLGQIHLPESHRWP